MNYKLFTVFDSKIQAFMPPFFQRSTGEALRSFSDAVRKEGSQFKEHAEDFTLFELGSWDDDSCKFDLLATPHSLGLALEFLDKV